MLALGEKNFMCGAKESILTFAHVAMITCNKFIHYMLFIIHINKYIQAFRLFDSGRRVLNKVIGDKYFYNFTGCMMLSATKNEFRHMHIIKLAAGEKDFICGPNLKKRGSEF